MAREPSTADRRARGRVADGPPRKLRLAEGDFLTDGRKLVEVHGVVLEGRTIDGKLVPDTAERHVLVTNATANPEDPPDIITLDDKNLRDWRNVKYVPYAMSKKWEDYVG